ncbi:Beta-galactosidase [Holothuria leucospilota]|uniref:Beta-galactosidase n=1 Tax=Holothuria leucospilota TaxID=206669 RepID=A0A9Q0YRS3_HOLLE|nr:Beta-galactosidase [Holothuria leucospilota]
MMTPKLCVVSASLLWLLLGLSAGSFFKTQGLESRANLNSPSFTIDWSNNTFLKDGVPFRYISGSIHYSRVPSMYWEDRLHKMYMAGLNAIQVYIPWNFHEISPGKYNFAGDANLTHFLSLAQQTGLLVILRPGPYICAEWDFGGLPAWLLKNTSIALRTSDEAYLEAVDGWMGVLLPKIKPFLYQNGGPIITVQVENEYGSFPACDYSYMRHLYQLFRSYLGDDVVLFTTDGAGKSYLKCGTLEDIYATVDFGPGTNVTKAFEAQREYEPKGPLVNSEFYTGWLDHWGQPHSVVSIDSVTKSLDQILSMGANVNMYMFEGGTNFGFWNGANGGGTAFNPQPTSYDYNAPLTESGDPTDKYFAIRDVISKHSLIPTGKDVVPVPKYAYGTIQMSLQATFYDVLDKMAPYGPINTTYPITMEQMQQYSGFMLYRTTIPFNVITPLYLNSTAIRDRGYVMINQIPQGMLTRIKNHSLSITALEGDTLDIFVESQGHLNYGPDLADPKGIFGNVTLNGTVLTQWSIFSLNFDGLMPNLRHIRKNMVKTKITTNLEQPSFYVGYLPDLSTINPPQDTFLKTSGWTKGQAYINGFNVGRYWPVKGPQVTLYVPASVLKPSPEKNVLLLFELEKAPCGPQETCSIEFIDRPIINGTVHNQFNTIHGRWKI